MICYAKIDNIIPTQNIFLEKSKIVYPSFDVSILISKSISVFFAFNFICSNARFGPKTYTAFIMTKEWKF